nr:rho GTPase-activating protein gacK-like [Dermatophagoides farinae]
MSSIGNIDMMTLQQKPATNASALAINSATISANNNSMLNGNQSSSASNNNNNGINIGHQRLDDTRLELIRLRRTNDYFRETLATNEHLIRLLEGIRECLERRNDDLMEICTCKNFLRPEFSQELDSKDLLKDLYTQYYQAKHGLPVNLSLTNVSSDLSSSSSLSSSPPSSLSSSPTNKLTNGYHGRKSPSSLKLSYSDNKRTTPPRVDTTQSLSTSPSSTSKSSPTTTTKTNNIHNNNFHHAHMMHIPTSPCGSSSSASSSSLSLSPTTTTTNTSSCSTTTKQQPLYNQRDIESINVSSLSPSAAAILTISAALAEMANNGKSNGQKNRSSLYEQAKNATAVLQAAATSSSSSSSLVNISKNDSNLNSIQNDDSNSSHSLQDNLVMTTDGGTATNGCRSNYRNNIDDDDECCKENTDTDIDNQTITRPTRLPILKSMLSPGDDDTMMTEEKIGM